MKILKNILLFIVGLLVILIIGEFYISVAGIAKTNWTIINPAVGKTNKPNTDVIYFSEGFYMGKINDFGYLGNDYERTKEPGKYRVALIGDSYTEGMHVFTRHHFMSLTENNLSEEGIDNFQILNFGKGIFDFNDMYCYYENFVSEFNPDLVYVFVSAVDFVESKKDVLPTVSLNDDSLQINFDFLDSDQYKKYKNFNILMKSSIGRLAFNCYKSLDNAKSILFGKFYFQEESTWKRDFESMDLSDVQRRIVKNMGESKKFVLVYLEEFPAQLSRSIKNNVEVLELEPLFDELKKQGIDPHYWNATNKFGHINHEGHKVVADFLSEDLMYRENNEN